MRYVPRVSPAFLVAGVRIGGAALSVLGLVVGLQFLGIQEFGASVILLAVGQLLALPGTSAERLVLRLTATARHAQSGHVSHLASKYALGLILISVVAAWPISSQGWATWPEVLAVGITGAMASEVALRQAACRADGRLMWGQVPNEIFRPTLTLIGYVSVTALVPKEQWAALATLFPALTTLCLIMFAPRPIDANRRLKSEDDARVSRHSPMASFVIIAIVAACIERLYPILAGSLGSASDASVLAVNLRLIQLGLFGQAIAIYYYSPHIASSVTADQKISASGRRALKNVRTLSAVCAIPVLIACFVLPDQLESFLGGVDLGRTVGYVALAIFAQMCTGPAQTLLVMSTGGEVSVAKVYVVGVAIGLLMYLLIGSWGADGAILAIGTTYSVFAIGQLYYARKQFGILV